MREWLYDIQKADRATATMTVRAIQQVLSGAGPEEPRPLVERIKGSRVRELRELRPATAGHAEVKLLFAFVGDSMVLLVAGENPGAWARWYRDAVPQAERRYQEYQEHPYHTPDDLMADLDLTDEELDRARERTDTFIRAWHLTQVRKAQDRTQSDLAQAMGVTQPRVSEIENGDLDRITLSTLRAYVRALGGRVRIVAEFGDAYEPHRYRGGETGNADRTYRLM